MALADRVIALLVAVGGSKQAGNSCSQEVPRHFKLVSIDHSIIEASDSVEW